MLVSDWRFDGAVGKVEFELLNLDPVPSAARTSTSEVMWRLSAPNAASLRAF
jgi:hypothetical protein